MKASRRWTLLFFAAWIIPAAHAGKPPSCSDYRLSWEIDSAVGIAIGGDGQGRYVDGQQGVSGTGYMCNGGYDATLQLGGAPTRIRSFILDFTRVLNPTSCTPGVPLEQYGGWFLNVQNLLTNYRQNEDYTDTRTMMGYLGFGGQQYTLRLNPNNTVANTPYTTSLVQVRHIPGSDERFEVTPLPSPSSDAMGKPVSGLVAAERKTYSNCGQFETPFKITIRILR